MTTVKIGIIGGTGLDDPEIFEDSEEKEVDTPYGKPSEKLLIGKINGVDCVLLSRHGKGHKVMPSTINYKANIHALKQEGCTHLVVTTACGSLQEHIKPGEFVLIDQFIDRTYKRQQTFYDTTSMAPCTKICHIPMAEPFCSKTRKLLGETISNFGFAFHDSGTMITIEGPRFSSRAESKLFKSWGADCINMTTVPEVVLANEAGLCYAAVALVTDYDSWRDDGDAVNVEAVMKTFVGMTKKICQVILECIPKIAAQDWSETLKENQVKVSGALM